MRRFLLTGLCAAALVAMSQAASAEQLVLETFSGYTAGTLAGQAAVGTGLTGTWSNGLSTAYGSAGSIVATGTAAGNALYGASTGSPSTHNMICANVTAGVSSATAGLSTVYFSFDTLQEAADTAATRLSLHSYNGANELTMEIGLNMNGQFNTELLVTNPWSGVYASNAGTTGLTTGVATTLVGKVVTTSAGVQTLTMYAVGAGTQFTNDTDLGAAVCTGTLNLGTYYDDSFGVTSVGVYSRIAAAGAERVVDNIRIGTTLADVTGAVVPEPSTLALLVGGLIGLIAYAWRKRK
jgi:hypothetical protein